MRKKETEKEEKHTLVLKKLCVIFVIFMIAMDEEWKFSLGQVMR